MIEWSARIGRGFESKELDYKEATTWDESDKKACCELVKDILAMANTGGGWIVVGVSETDSGFSQDGVTDEQAKSFETTRVNNFLNNYADPPINTRIHKPNIEETVFVGIEVPGFPDTPHVCQKDYPRVLTAPTVYVRTDNNESAPIKSSADFRAVIERATRNRGEHIVASMRAVLKHGVGEERPSAREQFESQASDARRRYDDQNPHREKGYGYRESVFHPASFIPDRFELPALKPMALNASVDLRGWPFLFADKMRPDLITAIEDGIESVLPDDFSERDELHSWQLRQSGMLYVRQLLREDTRRLTHGGNPSLSLESFSIIALESVNCLVKLYEGHLNEMEEVTLQFRLTGSKDRVLTASPSRYLRQEYVCHISDVTYTNTLSLADWRAGMIDHGLAICEYVFHRFNWETPNLHESKLLMEKAINRKL